jgi:hypothetical protein
VNIKKKSTVAPEMANNAWLTLSVFINSSLRYFRRIFVTWPAVAPSPLEAIHQSLNTEMPALLLHDHTC